MAKKFATGKRALGICDRSGFEYPYKELVIEPGTGYKVHTSESDGRWSTVNHAQNYPPADLDDALALEDPRPDRVEPQVDANGNAAEDSTDLFTEVSWETRFGFND